MQKIYFAKTCYRAIAGRIVIVRVSGEARQPRPALKSTPVELHLRLGEGKLLATIAGSSSQWKK